MPTSTYDLIASNVLSSPASSVTFSSIPATYRDLVLVADVLSTESSAFGTRFNGDTGSNYSNVRMIGNGSTATSASRTITYGGSDGETQGAQRVLIIDSIFDYAATDKHKSVLVRFNNSAKDTRAATYRWANTSAITSLTFGALGGGQMASGSTIYLYGIVS